MLLPHNRHNHKMQTCSTVFAESSHPQLIRQLPRCCQTLSCLATRMMKHTFSPLSSLMTDAHSWRRVLEQKNKDVGRSHSPIWREGEKNKNPSRGLFNLHHVAADQAPGGQPARSFSLCLFLSLSVLFRLAHSPPSLPHTHTHTHTGYTETTAERRCITFACNLCKKSVYSCTQLIYTPICICKKSKGTHRCKETRTQVGCSMAPTL